MFKIESYVTPILLSYVDKYVRDFKPQDAQVSLWGGGVALHNLVIKADVLQQELSLPFTLISGRIHELLIQVPWTKIMSEPIVVTIDTIECILGLNPPPDQTPSEESAEESSSNTQVVEAPPGYMQALVRKIVSNISLKVHHLIVKLVQDDIVLSLNIKHLSVESAGANWQPSFADIDPNTPVIRRLVRLDDLTLCLDRSDADGKIRFYLEPLLYRCQLDFRVLTRLVSVNVRRASSIGVEIRSQRLAWAICDDQLLLLLRLAQEIAARKVNEVPAATPKKSSTLDTLRDLGGPASASSLVEPQRASSWSEWAWSWLPAWEQDQSSPSPVISGPAPLPLAVCVKLDEIALMYKTMEAEHSAGKRRARSILDLTINHCIMKMSATAPTCLKIRFGLRDINLSSTGRCVCSHINAQTVKDEPTKYLHRSKPVDSSWDWPDDGMVEELCEAPPKENPHQAEVVMGKATMPTKPSAGSSKTSTSSKNESFSNVKIPKADISDDPNDPEDKHEPPNTAQVFWDEIDPLIFVEMCHYRTPPNQDINPYDDPPKDFEYSDWAEDSSITVVIRPLTLHCRSSLLHRLQTIQESLERLEPSTEQAKKPRRVLTVEEHEALLHNLPQHRVILEVNDFVVVIYPWDHSLTEKPQLRYLTLEVQAPMLTVHVTTPLYPHRVCSAASQIPSPVGSLFQASRIQLTVKCQPIQLFVKSETGVSRFVAKARLKMVVKMLLHKKFFEKADFEILHTNLNLKMYEFNLCSCAPRLFAVNYVLQSFIYKQSKPILWNSSVTKDAVSDESQVTLDFTIEEWFLRAYQTTNIVTAMSTLKSVKATVMQQQKDDETKQAWLFSGPDAPSNSPYIRLVLQFCTSPVPVAVEYFGIWTEPSAVSIDPMFAVLMGYRPVPRISPETFPPNLLNFQNKRRYTPPSSSGRGASRAGSGPELVHTRTRSSDSSPTPTEKQPPQEKEKRKKKKFKWYKGENLLELHKRLQQMTVLAEIGLTRVYVTVQPASAVNTVTISDAMERHAITKNIVIVIGLGMLTMGSNIESQNLWKLVRKDGPTLISDDTNSFPWKLIVADVSCYTLEVQAKIDTKGRDKAAHGLRSSLKAPLIATPRTIVELFTTTVVLTVVTKKAKYLKPSALAAAVKRSKKTPAKVKEEEEEDQDLVKQLEYFSSGIDFKPSTLKEFLRGPAERSRKKNTPEEPVEMQAEPSVLTGPIVSFGVNVHADTPPIVVRFDHDQVLMIATALHCIKHLLTLMENNRRLLRQHSFLDIPKSAQQQQASVSDIVEDASTSESDVPKEKNELISIFESAPSVVTKPMKTFFWFQWVIGRASIVVTTATVRLRIDIDDIIATVDIQKIYNQYKLKLTSVSVRHMESTGPDEWKTGVLNGRILEVREPATVKEDTYFLSVTITQAWIANLPESWRDVLHPRILNKKHVGGSVWEVYATVAPLEVMLRPNIMEILLLLFGEFVIPSECPFESTASMETSRSVTTSPKDSMEVPLIYLSAGGVRVLITGDVTGEDSDESSADGVEPDDTFIFQIGKITINPHPDNPIIRRAVSAHMETNFTPSDVGAQYELVVKGICLRSTGLSQILIQEARDAKMLAAGTAGENPAFHWSQPNTQPLCTTVLHSVNTSCVIAPANYNSNGMLTHGLAIEFNIITDCNIEISLHQLMLAKDLIVDTKKTIETTMDSCYSLLMLENKLQKLGTCPYAEPFKMQEQRFRYSRLYSDAPLEILPEPAEASTSGISAPIVEQSKADDKSSVASSNPMLLVDSGVETSYSKSSVTYKSSKPEIRKALSLERTHDQYKDTAQYLEVFVTTGLIELSFYCNDEMVRGYSILKIPKDFISMREKKEAKKREKESEKEKSKDGSDKDDNKKDNRRRSLTELDREMPGAVVQGRMLIQHAKRMAGNIPLLNLSLHQPNLYYWKRRHQKTLQTSLFDMWVGLGAGKDEGYWHKELLSTERGPLDPNTGVAPALATLRFKDNGTGVTSNSRASLTVDVERPILLEICTDRLKRLNDIIRLLKSHLLTDPDEFSSSSEDEVETVHPLLNLRRLLVSSNIDTVTLQTTQMTLGGLYGALGFDALAIQATTGARPDRIHASGLLTALFAAAGQRSVEAKAESTRNFVLQPITFGTEMEATWESWRRPDGKSPSDPTMHVCVEMDYATVELRPSDLDILATIRKAIDDVHKTKVDKMSTLLVAHDDEEDYAYQPKRHRHRNYSELDHFFKDDLRSGAFKMVRGSRVTIPSAYQVGVGGGCVTWRYPQPRAIAKLRAFPVPTEEKEIECVLEVYMPLIGTWEPHTHFKIPLEDMTEYKCTTFHEEAMFATTWRYRVLTDEEESRRIYQFDVSKYQPRMENTTPQSDKPESTLPPSGRDLASKLVSAVRVDSFFSPGAVPTVNVSIRCAGADVYVYNDLPMFHNKSPYFLGFYLSKPLTRSHRTLAVTLKNTVVHASPQTQILINTNIMSEVFDCTTGLMVPFVEEFKVQAALLLSRNYYLGPRLRGRCSHIKVAMHLLKIDTIRMMINDWQRAAEMHFQGIQLLSDPTELLVDNLRVAAGAVAESLRGRVSLWIHNSSCFPLRIGQEGTDENIVIEPEVRYAYRWHNPDVPKRLHFSLAAVTNTKDVTWSLGVPFVVGKHKVVLADQPGSVMQGLRLYIKVHEFQAKLYMKLYGRLTLANVLRIPFMYKVRQRSQDGLWTTLLNGELNSETIEQSVLCSSDTDMLLKIKLSSTGPNAWSGDIPLKECPKENVPWLVKVPNEGDMPYLSVWCRVTRGRADGRLLAAIWPLYMLKSNLPLDSDVTISTDLPVSSPGDPEPKPLVQGALGRGLVSHLHTAGTTSAKHSLTFQYRLIDSPVTPVSVPLHYGVTDVSVFYKQTPAQYVDEVVDEIHQWLHKGGSSLKSEWPFSLVRKHWPYQIQPAMLQPCSDVSIRYTAVRAGGGCSLQISLCPLVLLCNGSSISLTLRAHDASPLCKLEPGIALAPPSIILKKPFFISIERGQETFVSSELSVFGSELGEYEKPPARCVALNQPATFAILSGNRLSPFSLYYEIVDGMNILGVSSTYVFINRLDVDVKIAGVAVPEDMSSRMLLQPKKYKTVSPTTSSSNVQGTSLSRLFVYGRLLGSEPSKLRSFICLTLEGAHNTDANHAPLAVRLGEPPRRPAHLVNMAGKSVPVVVTQVLQEGRYIITVSRDPCPQFVFYNRSRLKLAVAEACGSGDKELKPVPEVLGASWQCVAPPGQWRHYSAPSHAARFPPPAPPPPHAAPPPPTQLCLAKVTDSILNIESWSSPIFVTEGEQLVKLGDSTVKLKIAIHPHSSLLEVRDVGTNDISASEIRRRLLHNPVYIGSTTAFKPHRIGANEKLLVPDALSENDPDEIDDQYDKLPISEVDILFQNELPRPKDEAKSSIPSQVVTQFNVTDRSNRYFSCLGKVSGMMKRNIEDQGQTDEAGASTSLVSPAAQQVLDEVVEAADETRSHQSAMDYTIPAVVSNVIQNLVHNVAPRQVDIPAGEETGVSVPPTTTEVTQFNLPNIASLLSATSPQENVPTAPSVYEVPQVNLPNVASVLPNRPTVPELPHFTLPNVASILPNRPTVPDVAQFNLPNVRSLLPNRPAVPELPHFTLPNVASILPNRATVPELPHFSVPNVASVLPNRPMVPDLPHFTLQSVASILHNRPTVPEISRLNLPNVGSVLQTTFSHSNFQIRDNTPIILGESHLTNESLTGPDLPPIGLTNEIPRVPSAVTHVLDNITNLPARPAGLPTISQDIGNIQNLPTEPTGNIQNLPTRPTGTDEPQIVIANETPRVPSVTTQVIGTVTNLPTLTTYTNVQQYNVPTATPRVPSDVTPGNIANLTTTEPQVPHILNIITGKTVLEVQQTILTQETPVMTTLTQEATSKAQQIELNKKAEDTSSKDIAPDPTAPEEVQSSSTHKPQVAFPTQDKTDSDKNIASSLSLQREHQVSFNQKTHRLPADNLPSTSSSGYTPVLSDNPMVDILGEVDPSLPILHPKSPFLSDLNVLKPYKSLLEEEFRSTEDWRSTVADDICSIMQDFCGSDMQDTVMDWRELERVRFTVSGIVLEIASDETKPPLMAAYVDRAHILIANDTKRIRGTFSVADIQIDNLQHSSGQFDFPVIASTRIVPLAEEKWPPICSFFFEKESSKQNEARLLLKTCFDKWRVAQDEFCELTEVDARLGPLSLYVEDAFVTTAAAMMKDALPPAAADDLAAETRSLVAPLRLRSLQIQPLDLTLTLHTAVRMYIALDHSPLRLSAFQVRDMMTSSERLAHALTVHYLSAAILGAGWMVGGLELLGAPGALAARVGGATGGVRGVAAAAAAAVLRSLSAWAGSLARNLDIIAGDEEHAARAAAARRQPPATFFEGVALGLANLAVNLLGAVGGLAHHPLVGMAVGETDSSVSALRRGLLGALTKPLSATADLVAYAGHGLLAQTGWDPEPQARRAAALGPVAAPGWRRDCSRWAQAAAALLAGGDVLLQHQPARLLMHAHHLVFVDPQTEKLIEMVNLSNCTIGPYSGAVIELRILPKKPTKPSGVANTTIEDEEQVSQAAMARVAKYTGATSPGTGGGGGTDYRPLVILPPTGRSLALYSLLVTIIHHSSQHYCNAL